jgi:hypothetical protein
MFFYKRSVKRLRTTIKSEREKDDKEGESLESTNSTVVSWIVVVDGKTEVRK